MIYRMWISLALLASCAGGVIGCMNAPARMEATIAERPAGAESEEPEDGFDHHLTVHDAYTVEDVFNRHQAFWTVRFRWNAQWEGNQLRIRDAEGPTVEVGAREGSGWGDLRVWVEKSEVRPTPYLAQLDRLPEGCEEEVLDYSFIVLRFQKTTPSAGRALNSAMPPGDGYVVIRCQLFADGAASYQVMQQNGVYEGDAVQHYLHSREPIRQPAEEIPPRPIE